MSRPSRGRPRVAVVSYEVYEHAGAERALVETIRRTRDLIDWTVVSRSLPDDLRPLVTWRRAWAPRRPFRLKLAAFLVTAGFQLARTPRTLLYVSGPILLQRPDVVSVQFLRALFYEAVGAPRRVTTRAHVGLEAWFLRRTRAFAAPSLLMLRELERRLPGIPVYLTPNGVDLERFRPDAEDREAFRRELGTRDGCVAALFVGNAFTQKGLPIAIEAVGRVRAAGADVELWVCGQGPPERYFELAVHAGAGDAVRFFGVRRDIERFYRAADVFVFPSAYETFPLSTLEAAASETPLIVTPVGGMEELTGDGGAGLVVERTADAVTEALLRLAREPELRMRLGREARQRAARYGWDAAIEALLAVYDDLLGEPLIRGSGASRGSAA
jgi:glycosyltransferase involved in cell wall biosynthesis